MGILNIYIAQHVIRVYNTYKEAAEMQKYNVQVTTFSYGYIQMAQRDVSLTGCV